ncbi:MAG: ABC transporter permease, partial [Gammaproteobacteria bacterium]|nr:ABC transporter permease [Gammaproteobacteria bacterium]
MIDFWRRFFGSDIWWSYKSSPLVVIASLITFIIIFSSVFATYVAPFNPFDLAQFDLMDSLKPPIWMEDSDSKFFLGTDDQGRDVLSTILYGSRVSLLVGFMSVFF